MFRISRIAILVLALLAGAPAAWSQETKTLTSEGVAVIQDGAMDTARDAALEDARKRAVEQAIGILIDSQTRIENYRLISDKILSRTRGYLTQYTIAGETVEDTLLRVRINAEVSLGKLTRDLSGIGILPGQTHKPRTMIMIAEQNVGHEWRAWWWGHQGQRTDIGAVENAFIDVFAKKGFEFIGRDAAERNIRVTAAYKVPDLAPDQARTLGNQADAEVVIVGKAAARSYGDIGGGRKSAQAELSARAVRTDTGQILASAATHGSAVRTTEETAGIEALRKAAQAAADQMADRILAVYSREAGTKPVNITVTGLNKAQFVKFKDMLKNRVRGIRDLHERSFSGNTARISADCMGSAQSLSGELALKDFGAFAVEVVGSTANSLELKVTPK